LKLRTHLLLLAAGVVLPIAIFAALQATLLVRHEADRFRQAAMEHSRTLMTAVDAELRGSIATLHALSTSRSLEADDLKTFHEEAARVLLSQPGWITITLADPTGQQLVNPLIAFGEPLPVIKERETLELALKSGKPTVGGVTVGLSTSRPGVPIRIPVVHGTRSRVLTAFIKLEAFDELLRAQRLAEDWRLGITDANGYFVARLPALPPGPPVRAVLYETLRQSPEGWFRGRTTDGTETYVAYNTSPYSGWLAAIAPPAAVIDQTARRAIVTTTMGLAFALLAALTLALLLSRRISGPIASLAAGARALGRGEALELPTQQRVDEVNRVAEALREAAAAVNEREEALEAASRSKDEFLAMLSHELRNPLAAIVTSVQVLQRAQERPDIVRQTVGVLDRQSAQMRRLVEDLLDVSRIATGKISLERSPLDLANTVERVVTTWRGAGRFDRHEVAVDLAPAWIEGDAARIEQIISNLLDNSVKFTPQGGRITVRTSRRGEQSLLEVIDTGAGLDESLQRSMFEVFVQGGQSIDRSSGGLGLGLSIVRRLAMLHGGHAEAHSEGVGRGTTMKVCLPAIEPQVTSSADSAPAMRHSAKRDILLVEDNDDSRAMIRTALEFEGHTVRDAADGAAALAIVREKAPDVAVLDIGLPGMTGYELAKRMREIVGREVRLVALTGYGQPEDKARAIEAGFDAHLTKPVEQAALLDVIG
jgi:signal transduction histidine kinase